MFKKFMAKLVESPEIIAGALFVATLVIVSVLALTSDRVPVNGVVEPRSEQVSYDDVLRQFKLVFFEHGIMRSELFESADGDSHHLSLSIPVEIYDNVTNELVLVMSSNFPTVHNPRPGYYYGETDSFQLELTVHRLPALSDIPVLEEGKGSIALLIDDGGSNLELAERLAALDIPLTVAVLPHLQHSRATAELMRTMGKSVYLHFPMQPLSYPETDPGMGAVLMDMPEMLVKATVEKDVESIGRIDGMNNHMGSAITESREKMQQVLMAMKPYSTNFVDSNTSTRTVAFAVCNEIDGFNCGLNIKFLDNENNHDYIKARLREAVDMAMAQGEVIVIGHLRPDTIEVLEEVVPQLRQESISFAEVNAVLQ